MPPKGWRKNAEGNYPHAKNDDSISIDDLLFPKATVQKLAKNILNADKDGNDTNMIMAKDSILALQRSATVFVSNMLFNARQVSKNNSRKTVNALDIINALETSDFTGFIPEVKHKLEIYEGSLSTRRKERSQKAVIEGESQTEESRDKVAKRLKDNSKNPITKGIETAANQDEEDEEVEEEEEVENKEEDDDATDDVIVEEEEDVEKVVENPIAALQKEEKTLEELEDDHLVDDSIISQDEEDNEEDSD